MLVEWLYDIDEINDRIIQNVNDIVALDTLRKIIEANIYSIEKGNLIEERVDGKIYETNFPAVVWRDKSNLDEIVPDDNILFIYVFKNEREYVLEQRIKGVSIRNKKFKKISFEKVYEFLIMNYSISAYEIDDDSIVVKNKLKILNTSFHSGKSKKVMEQLYNFLRRICLRDKINSYYLEFFDQTYPDIAPELPKNDKYKDKTLLIEFAKNYNSWITNAGYTINSIPTLKFNPLIPHDLQDEAKELLRFMNTPLLSENTSELIVLYRNVQGIIQYTITSNMFNDKLRKNEPLNRFRREDYNDIITALQESRPVNYQYALLRGTMSNPFRDSKIIKDFGFMSKTNDRDVASGFAAGKYLMKIIYPPGTRQIFIESISYNEGEMEFLTYPGEVLEYINEIKYPSYTLILCKWIRNETEEVYIDNDLDRKCHKLLKNIVEPLLTSKSDNMYLYRDYNEINMNRNFFRIIRYIFDLESIYEFKSIKIENKEYQLINDEFIQVSGPVEQPNIFILNNENLLIDNAFFITRLVDLLPLLNYELSSENGISHEANEYLQVLTTLLNKIVTPRENYILYAASLNEPIIKKKLKQDDVYKIPISYSKTVKHLAYSDGYITLPNEIFKKGKHLKFKNIGFNSITSKVNINIDVQIEEKISRILKTISEINIENEELRVKSLIINPERDSINIDADETKLYLELFKVFRMNKVDEVQINTEETQFILKMNN